LAAGQLGLTGRAQPVFSQIHEKHTTTFGSRTAQELSSNFSIRQWIFRFSLFELVNFMFGFFFRVLCRVFRKSYAVLVQFQILKKLLFLGFMGILGFFNPNEKYGAEKLFFLLTP
jgi:hypothetical protein